MNALQKFIHTFKEKIKIYMPKWLYFMITKKTDARLEQHFQTLVDMYYINRKNH